MAATRLTDGKNMATFDQVTGGLKVSLTSNLVHTAVMDSLSAGALNADLLPSTDVSGYRSANVQINGTWSGTLTFQASNDNVNFQNIIVVGLLSVSGFNGASTTSNGLFSVAIGFKYLRIRMTAFTSGLATGVCTFSDLPGQANIVCASVQNTITTAGLAGEGSTPSGNPLRLGLETRTTLPTARSDNQMNKLIGTTDGRQTINHYQVPEQTFQFACAAAITNTTDTAVAAAAGSGIRNYLTSFQFRNTHATVGTEVVVKDGSTVIWRGYAPANMVSATDVVFPVPLRGTANTPVNFACITAGASVYFNAQGYKAY